MEMDHLNALLVAVQTGTSHVSLTFVNNGRHMVTADWNRFNLARIRVFSQHFPFPPLGRGSCCFVLSDG